MILLLSAKHLILPKTWVFEVIICVKFLNRIGLGFLFSVEVGSFEPFKESWPILVLKIEDKRENLKIFLSLEATILLFCFRRARSCGCDNVYSIHQLCFRSHDGIILPYLHFISHPMTNAALKSLPGILLGLS